MQGKLIYKCENCGKTFNVDSKEDVDLGKISISLTVDFENLVKKKVDYIFMQTPVLSHVCSDLKTKTVIGTAKCLRVEVLKKDIAK